MELERLGTAAVYHPVPISSEVSPVEFSGIYTVTPGKGARNAALAFLIIHVRFIE